MIRSNSCFLFEIYSNFLFFSTTWINLISIRLKSPNSYFIIEITYCPHCPSIFLQRIAKFATLTQEQPVITEPIYAVQISSNLQFSTKVLKFGTLFLFQSLVHQTCLALRRKCKSFYSNNLWIGRTFAALFLSFIYYCKWGGSPKSPVASWVSSPINAVNKFLYCVNKVNKDDNDDNDEEVCIVQIFLYEETECNPMKILQ